MFKDVAARNVYTPQIKGKIISGQFGKLIARQKYGQSLEIGELLIVDSKDADSKDADSKDADSKDAGSRNKILLQVTDLLYGSQISLQNLELVAGMGLEEDSSLEFMDKELRNYNLAVLKSLVEINDDCAVMCKQLPSFFSELRSPCSDDFSFLTKPSDPLFFGKLRSGTKVLDFDVCLDAGSVLTHHVLVSATTGRGKSNLCSVLLWNICDADCAGVLVIDPHDEYYGRTRLGLKDHPKFCDGKIIYYTASDVPPGCRTLKINTSVLRPDHFNSVVEWSDAQKDVINAYRREHKNRWIEAILTNSHAGNVELNPASIAVVKRRLLSLLDMRVVDGRLVCSGVFDLDLGKSTVSDILAALERGKIVIVDTSPFSGSIELLIGTVIASEAFDNYKRYKASGDLKDLPVISIVLEEAPRVLGRDVLEKGPNVFSSIAREGRKFKLGLVAITQLPSLIPRQILANINTKIIMGTEMKPERQALIESAAQDLSDDDRNIASLDKGEAIITSNFARFALPVKIPLFDDYALRSLRVDNAKGLNNEINSGLHHASGLREGGKYLGGSKIGSKKSFQGIRFD